MQTLVNNATTTEVSIEAIRDNARLIGDLLRTMPGPDALRMPLATLRTLASRYHADPVQMLMCPPLLGLPVEIDESLQADTVEMIATRREQETAEEWLRRCSELEGVVGCQPYVQAPPRSRRC